ncbi:unnamed protein product [Brassica napus]|uniref:(rape) hypothetical protein n=1 Tax=Brassica napus TaxID=3708 RepID=A0A816LYI4_BRANA|nr:unnamed protein product [Brassica napus]
MLATSLWIHSSVTVKLRLQKTASLSCSSYRYPKSVTNEYRLNSDFIKEYIFPGGCLPSLARVISAMASSSRLRQIMDLGFDDKFIRTWEYYFDYCAAGIKTLTLEDYQVVFSRPGNVAAFGDPFRNFPSAHN